MAQKVLHKRSRDVEAIPSLEFGEIAVNYSVQDPHLTIKDEQGKLITFSSDNEIANNLVTALKDKSDVGHTHTKAQITDFAHTHGTVTLTGDATGSANFTNTGASIAVTVKDDSHTHDGRYYTEEEIDTKIDSINETIEENELVTSTALNELNDRVSDVEVNRAPTVHTHTKSDITDFAHTHSKADITDFAHTHGTVTLTGDATGSANFTNTGASIAVTVKDDSHNHTITATATDDDVVVLTGTNGTNKVTFDAKHATQGPNTTGNTATTDTTTAQSPAYGGKIELHIPKITVNKYGHVTDLSDQTVAVTLPADSNTHHQAKNVVGASSSAKADAAATNGNVWLNLIENSTVRSNTNIKGAGATTVTSDSAGTITITSTDTIYTALKNPYSLTVQKNGTTVATYDGSAATTANISVPTKISELTNDLKPLTVGGKTYNGSAAVDITASDLGLAAALKYCGVTTTALSDGATTNPITINNASHTATPGCVVFYGDKEFVFNGTAWELLGAEATYKVVQSAVSSPSASGNATAFIDTIKQDTNGVITATKKNITTASTSAYGITKLSSAINSTSEDLAATPQAVKTAYDKAATAQSTADGKWTAATATTATTGIAKLVEGDLSGVTKTTAGQAASSYHTHSQYQPKGDYASSSHSHSSYVNQNAFSNVKVGTKTVAADSATDTLTLVAGSNVTITPDATNGSITIAATDTVYTHPTSAGNKHIPSGGASGQFLGWSADGTAAWVNNPNTDTNTSHSHSVGVGLTGSGTAGTGGGTYTYKAKLRSETAFTVDSAAATTGATNKIYPIAVDKSGYLSVYVPWTDTNTDTATTQSGHYTPSTSASTVGATSGNNYIRGINLDSKKHVISVATGTPTNTTYSAGSGLVLSNTTFSADGSAIINALVEGTSAAQRTDYIVAQYAGGGTATTTYHRRSLANIFAALNKSDITTALGYTPPTADTNTWRGVQCNGTSIGSNTLNLKAGTNVTLSNSSGAITISSTNTTYGIANNSTAGLVKPLKHYSGSISSPSATSATTAPSVNAITTTSGRYYAVEMDAAGRMFVNVPWTNTDSDTWRPVYDGVDSTSTTSGATANAVKTAYDKAVSAYDLANSKTSNTGTVTSVKVTGGTGLSGGGTVSTSGTITLNHAAVYTGTSLTTSGANYYITGLTMDGLGHVTGISQSYDDNSTYSTVTTSAAGLAPSAGSSGGTIGTQSTDWVLTNKNGTIGWYRLPSNAFNDNNTNYYLTGVTGDGNGDVTFSRYGLSDITWDASHSHAASAITGGTSGYFLKADSNGKGVWTSVTIPSAYSLPTASSSTKGGVKVGSFLSISSEALSVSTGTSSATVARGDHSHSASAITGGTLNIARIPTGTDANSVALGNHDHSGTYIPLAGAPTASPVTGNIYIKNASVILSGTSTYCVVRPYTNGEGALGTSLYRWEKCYANSFNGYTLGDACAKGVATSVTSTSTNLPTASAVYSFVEDKIGDVSFTETYKGTVTSVKVTGGTGLSGGGTVSTSGEITLSHGDTSTLSGAYGTTATTSVGAVKQVTVDEFGHVTGIITGSVPTYTALANSASTVYLCGSNSTALTNGNTYLTKSPNYYISGNTFYVPNPDSIHFYNLDTSLGNFIANAYGVAKNNKLGLVKPLKHYSGSVTSPSATSATTAPTVNDITTTSGRYYAVEMDASGRMFVNVPWSDGSTTTGSYLPLTGGTLTGGVTGTTMKLTGDLRLSGSTDYGSGRYIYFGDDSNAYISEITDDELTIYGSERITLTTSYDQTLFLADDGAYFNCAVYSTSDERLKDFCDEIDVDFDKLKNIPKSYFTWKSDENKKLQIGTSAQKVKELYPELVGGTEEETLSVDYAKLSIVALKAIDVLHDENEKLKSIIEKMDERITELEKKLGE